MPRPGGRPHGAICGRNGAASHIYDLGSAGCRRADPKVNNQDMTGVLFFDGACGMCTRSVYFLMRHDRTGHVQTEPLQGAGVAERLGIREDQLLEAMRWLDSSGAVYTGAEAWAAAWSVPLGSRLPLLIYRVPGIRFIQN